MLRDVTEMDREDLEKEALQLREDVEVLRAAVRKAHAFTAAIVKSPYWDAEEKELAKPVFEQASEALKTTYRGP